MLSPPAGAPNYHEPQGGPKWLPAILAGWSGGAPVWMATAPRTHPKHSGRKATKVRPPFAESEKPPSDSDALDSDLLGRFSRALVGWSTTDARVDGQERFGGVP